MTQRHKGEGSDGGTHSDDGGGKGSGSGSSGSSSGSSSSGSSSGNSGNSNAAGNGHAEGPWTIAELATEFDVTHRTIRFYEDRGLLTPERRGTQRIFHPRDRVRLALILRGRRLGFALEEVRRIVDMYDEDPGEAGQLRYLLDQIAARRAELEQRRDDIEQTLAELADVEDRCRATLAQRST